MKRFILGIGWFTIINFSINFIGGFVVGFANASANSSASGAQVGASFSKQYGGLIFIIAVLVAGIGTAIGKLPYTEKDIVSKAE